MGIVAQVYQLDPSDFDLALCFKISSLTQVLGTIVLLGGRKSFGDIRESDEKIKRVCSLFYGSHPENFSNFLWPSRSSSLK